MHALGRFPFDFLIPLQLLSFAEQMSAVVIVSLSNGGLGLTTGTISLIS